MTARVRRRVTGAGAAFQAPEARAAGSCPPGASDSAMAAHGRSASSSRPGPSNCPGRRVAAQPATTTRRPARAMRCTSRRDLRSASAVTQQVWTTTRSASSPRATERRPAPHSAPSASSLSAWLTLQPTKTVATVVTRASGGAASARHPSAAVPRPRRPGTRRQLCPPAQPAGPRAADAWARDRVLQRHRCRRRAGRAEGSVEERCWRPRCRPPARGSRGRWRRPPERSGAARSGRRCQPPRAPPPGRCRRRTPVRSPGAAPRRAPLRIRCPGREGVLEGSPGSPPGTGACWRARRYRRQGRPRRQRPRGRRAADTTGDAGRACRRRGACGSAARRPPSRGAHATPRDGPTPRAAPASPPPASAPQHLLRSRRPACARRPPPASRRSAGSRRARLPADARIPVRPGPTAVRRPRLPTNRLSRAEPRRAPRPPPVPVAACTACTRAASLAKNGPDLVEKALVGLVVRVGGERGELLEHLALLVRKLPRHQHVHDHLEVAAAQALEHRDATVAVHLGLAGLRARGQLHLDVAVECRHVGGGAQRSLDHGDVLPVDEVVAIAHQALVRLHDNGHVEIAGAAALSAGPAVAGVTDTLAVGDARGDVHRDAARDAQPPGPPTALARFLDDAPPAATDVAGAGADELAEAAQAGDFAHAAAAVALRAALAPGPRARAAALTLLAGRVGAHLDFLGRTEHGLGERELDRDLHILATRRRRVPGGGAPHAAGVAQHRVETPAEESTEEIIEAHMLEIGHLTTAEPIEAIAVVGGPRVGVADDLVGLGGLLELRLALS